MKHGWFMLISVLSGMVLLLLSFFRVSADPVSAIGASTYTIYLPLLANRWPPVLAVGMQLRWDGKGYIRGSEYYDIGSHTQYDLNGMTDADTIRCHAYQWYNPNPLNLESETWDMYYSISTGAFKSSTLPDDPAWKWGYPWFLPFNWQSQNGQFVSVYGQSFLVSGPHSGYTAFGKPVQYWQLTNRDKFLFWDGGGDWKQYVHSGEAKLQYDAGSNRVLLQSDVMRHYYYRGSLTADTVQYVENLTLDNAFRGTERNVGWAEMPTVPMLKPSDIY